MPSPPFHTRLVRWQDAEPLLRAVRTTVFIHEQRIPESLEWDQDDPRVMHALAADRDGHPIGTGRLLLHGDTARIGRMAVLAEWRGCGVGASVMHCLLDEARRRGARRAFLHAQTVAVPFYERFGFVCEGDEFIEDDIAHYKMRRDPI
jgi:predicted GNAT family N-acyltransferase